MIIISHNLTSRMCFNLKVLTVVAVSAVFGIGRANGGSYLYTDVKYLIPKQYCEFLSEHGKALGANESWKRAPAAPEETRLLSGTDILRDRYRCLCDKCLGVIFYTLVWVENELIKDELEKNQSSLVTLSKNLNTDNTLPKNEKTISLSSLVTLFKNLNADNTLPDNQKEIREQFLEEIERNKKADRCKFSLAAEKIGKDEELWKLFLKAMVPVTRGFLLCDAFEKKYGVKMTDYHAKFLAPERYLEDTTLELLKNFYQGYQKTIRRCRSVRKLIEYSSFPFESYSIKNESELEIDKSKLKNMRFWGLASKTKRETNWLKLNNELKAGLWGLSGKLGIDEDFGDVVADFKLYESLPYGMPEFLQPVFSFSDESHREWAMSKVDGFFGSYASEMPEDVANEFNHWQLNTCSDCYYLHPEKEFRKGKFPNSVTGCNEAFQVLFKKLVKNYAGDTEQLITFLESIDEEHKEHRDCLSVICYVCSRIEALKKKIKVQEKAGNLEKDKIEVQKGK